MLRELACAADFSASALDNALTDKEIWSMATSGSAQATGSARSLGGLVVGHLADIAIFDGRSRSTHAAVVHSEPQDVVLVARGGRTLYGDAALVDSTCDAIEICTTQKRICLGDTIEASLASLIADAGAAAYPLVACGVPANERTCVARRTEVVNGSTVYDGPTPDDPDGDGVTTGDNCPRVFNPVRPMDDGIQPDTDGDGSGDACDVR